jgi:hypothetical protein
MSTPTLNPTAPGAAQPTPARGLELPAFLTVLWSLAGGMLLGGASVAAMQFAGRMSPHIMIVAATMMFLLGALAGFVHGSVLGILGRPASMSRRAAVGSLIHGLLYLVPSLVVGWLLAGWVAALPLALFGGHVLASVISGLAWVAMLAVTVLAVSRGVRALVYAYRRWDDRVLGSALIGAVLVGLLVAFLVEPPTLWFFGTKLSRLGGVILAIGATFWFYGPMITIALRIARELGLMAHVLRTSWRHALGSATIAVGTGLGLALIAVPFYAAGPRVPTGFEGHSVLAALVATVAGAFTNEMLFRMIVMTVTLVLAMRALPTHRYWAIGLAIGVSALADLVLHLPQVTHLGMPGIAIALAYALVRLAIPAVMFGYLYSRRGIGTAVGAHAAADVALVLLAA